MDTLEFFDSLEKFQQIIYRRPNFLSEDFEYEQYIGQNVLRNIFSLSPEVDSNTDYIALIFPERWINCVECFELFPRIQKYYPNLKRLFVKTHAPLIITNVPAKYSFELNSENEVVSKTGSNGDDPITSVDDSMAFFPGISEGRLYVNGNSF
jgi:hypothetical protein